MNIISLLIGWVGFYFSKNAGITLIGIVISIMSIAGFETSLVKYSESDKNSYRIKFYDISVWIVGFVPVCIICEYMPVLSELLETAFGTFIGRSAGFAITYFVICLAVREIVGKKIQ